MKSSIVSNMALHSDVKKALEELLTIGDIVRWGTTKFKLAPLHYGHGFDNALDEVLFIVATALHLDLPIAEQFFNARLTFKERKGILALFEKRISERKPAAYLVGKGLFCGLSFKVSPSVLIPRSPFAELIVNDFRPFVDISFVESVLEIGTGCGCIAIAMAKEYPHINILATDISDEAIALAEENIKTHNVEDQVTIVKTNCFDGIKQTFDLIISNPPYVPVNVIGELPPEYSYEPVDALNGGYDGLSIVEEILGSAPNFLREQASLFIEMGEAQQNFEQKYPSLPCTWLELEKGGSGLVMIERSALISDDN